jgi:hypothetical protein
MKIGESYDATELSGAITDLRLVGHIVGSVQHSTDISCKDQCPPGYQPTSAVVQVDDLRRHLRRSAPLNGNLLGHDLLLARSGTAAWLEGSSGNARLQKLGGAGEQLIDQGNIDQASVKLFGSTLSWTKDGQPHSTPLN